MRREFQVWIPEIGTMINRLLTYVNLLLITLIVFLAVNVFYKALTARLEILPSGSSRQLGPPRTEAPEKPALSAYHNIAQRNLFKTANRSAPASEKLNLAQLKPTELNLKLWGTATGTAQPAYAVIEDAGTKAQDLYRIGDQVQTATLKAILRGKVVLDVGGRDEVLSMEDTERVSAVGPTRQALPEAAAPTTAPQRININRAMIEAALGNITTLMTQVKMQPHLEEGQSDGMLVTAIQPNSIFMRLGLRNGDIVSSVDGKNIGTMDDALAMYENLKSASQVTLALKRKGRPKIIEYFIE